MTTRAQNSESAMPGVKLNGTLEDGFDKILTAEALNFIAELHRKFNLERLRLLDARRVRQTEFDRGGLPGFLDSTRSVREAQWRVAPAPADLDDRRVEITGPVDRKMVINALNSGAKVFMADFEDSHSPTWKGTIEGQLNLRAAVRRDLGFTSPEGKTYALKDQVATLVVRPRGWHLPENHLLVDGEPVSGSLFDFGLYFFHNAAELLKRGSGPYFYLPKLESHLEARLWNQVFVHAQKALGIPHGSIRATVLIETILAAFEMDEILYELKDHAAGLNAGRWDYIFSVIKKFRNNKSFVLPDRADVTMAVPFMRAYAQLIVRTCHRRGAHAMGGMSAFIPSRKDPEVNRVAMAKVREDKQREAGDGFDGTWVAHPDLVSVAMEIFNEALGSKPNQKERLRDDVDVKPADLLSVNLCPGAITEAGIRNNINVALQYLNHWLMGLGAVAIHNLMEDAATAEISRAQLWQWIHSGAKTKDGRVVDSGLYKKIRDEETRDLGGTQQGRMSDAVELLDGLVLDADFAEFLTLPAYPKLN